MNDHDLFTVRRLSALRDTLASIAADVTLAEAVRRAAWDAWDTLRMELEALENELSRKEAAWMG